MGGLGGAVCDHTEAGWSKAIRDLFFFPQQQYGRGLRFELRHKDEENYTERGEGAGGSRALIHDGADLVFVL